MTTKKTLLHFVSIVILIVSCSIESNAGELYVGATTVSITPDQPVALAGQMHTRISHTVESEVTATALAIETRDGDQVVEQAVMVSCDLAVIRGGLLNKVRNRLKGKLPGLDLSKIFISATHTHTAPVVLEGNYEIHDSDVMMPKEYAAFLLDQVSTAIIDAWNSRKPARVGWGLGHAVVAYNRRSVYADGSAAMYGATNRPDFRGIEGYEDHGVEVLYFWNLEDQLIATAINVACPAQEMESGSTINADFWHPVREALQAEHGNDLAVLGWIGAAGDQSPHIRFRKDAEDRMRRLRGHSRLQEISSRILRAWHEAYDGAIQEQHSNLPFEHQVRTLDLPARIVTDAEFEATKAEVAKLANNPKLFRKMKWNQDVLDRYREQQAGNGKTYATEVHAIRLGDVAIATNQFELFTKFGIQMKSRLRALQTFVVQLAGPGTYVPTERAAAGGGYSAIVASNEVGHEGGQQLTDRTIEMVNSMWDEGSQAHLQETKFNNSIVNEVYPATEENPRYSEGSILPLQDGSILYATTEFIGSNSDFARARIVARISRDGGKSWGPIRVLQENVGGLNVMSVSLLRLTANDNSPIGMFYLVKNSHNDLDVFLRTSTDEAQSFSEPVLVTDAPGYHVMNNDRVVRLSSGRLLCPIAWTSDVTKENHFVSFCYFSDDQGQTWHASENRVDLPKRGAMEPEVLELNDGRVLMIMRTQFPQIHASISEDGAQTWSDPYPWGVHSPESPATLRRIPSTGDLLLIWNPNYTEGLGHSGKRTPLNTAISRDEGKTWQPNRILDGRDDETYAYTSLTFTDDRALLSYYVGHEKSGRYSSRFRSLPIEWFYGKQ